MFGGAIKHTFLRGTCAVLTGILTLAHAASAQDVSNVPVATATPQIQPGYVYINGEFVPDTSATREQYSDAPVDGTTTSFQDSLDQLVTIGLNVDFNGRSLGSVTAETTLASVRAIQSIQLRELLAPYVNEDVLLAVAALGDGFVSVEDLEAAGLSVRLNPATLSLVVESPPKDRGTLDLSFSNSKPLNAKTVDPANFAAGLTTALNISDNLSESGDPLALLAFSGFVNVGGVQGVNFDYGGDVSLSGDSFGERFVGDRAVLFMDRPEQALRYEAGTLFNTLSGLAGGTDFLGVGIRKSYRDLQPTRVLRPLGNRAFQLEQAGEVTVLVNGQEVSRFDATAGPINLRDIPLVDVSNNVAIVVEDQFGRRVTESFSVASDVFLLEPGLTEYAAGIGQVRDQRELGFNYTDEVAFSGNIQHGISPNYTQGGYAYLSDELAVAGVQSVMSVLNGVGQVEASYSDTSGGMSGAAVGVDYRWSNAFNSPRGQSFAVAADYRERGYNPVGGLFGSNIKYDITAFYDRELTDDLRLNVSANHSKFYDDGLTTSNISAGTTYQFGQTIIGGGVRYLSTSNQPDEVGVFVNLTRRLGTQRTANARYDSLTDRGSIRVRKTPFNELGNLGYNAELRSRGGDLSALGGLDYIANRYRARVAIGQGGRNASFDGDTTLNARFQTGFAFADGQFGIGRDPGRGFTMVSRHESLSDADVLITTRARRALRAKSGPLGPAVFRTTAPYLPEVIEVDVADAPLGYDIGEGVYFTVPGARSGYNIKVGSDAFRTRVGAFTRGGAPLGLSTGTVTNTQTGASQFVFTNRNGRAVLSKLDAGPHEITFTNSGLTHSFTVGEDSVVYEDFGTIELNDGVGQ